MNEVNSDDMLRLFESGVCRKDIAATAGKTLQAVDRALSSARIRRNRQHKGQELIERIVADDEARDVASLTDIFSEKLIWPDVVSNTYFVLPDSTVFSMSSRSPAGKILHGTVHENKCYRKLALKRYDSAAPRQVYLHQIVAYAFCQEQRFAPEQRFVTHIEKADASVPFNNHMQNLYFSEKCGGGVTC